MNRYCTLLMALSLAACAAPVPIEPAASATTQRFDRTEAAASLTRGTGLVRGAVMVKMGRESASCGGATVYLIPATAYANERMTMLFGPDTGRTLMRIDASAPAVEAAPAAWLETTLQTRCDTRGNFYFDQVGPGTYWVWTTLRWGQDEPPMQGSITQRLTVLPGQTVNLLLSP